MKFVHLHTHSHYSLLDGLAKIDDLIARTKELGMKAVALTDHGNLYGAIEFYKKAVQSDIKPILGIEAYIAPNGRLDKIARVDDKYFHLILLCENETGWKNLIKLITKANLEGFYYKPRMDKELLREHHEGLIALSACISGEVARNLLKDKSEEAVRVAMEYQEIFGKGNFFLEIGHHPNIPEVVKANKLIIELSKKTEIPLVATQDIHYLNKEDAEYHDILLAVQTGSKLTDDDRLTLKADDFSMTSPEQMEIFFKDTPEAVSNTVKIADRCDVNIKLHQTLLPEFYLPENEISSASYLKKLTMENLPKRYAIADAKINERVDYELSVIEKTGFADYFLIVQDFVNWAKQRGIMVGPGRGSAAGSIISYILGITDIDPLKYGLLFERFLNPERISMPDIDLDFADTRRDEVLAYLRQKYGEDRVAQIITFGTMAARAALRDTGRALGLPYGLCDQLAKMIPFNMNLEESLKKVPELKEIYESNSDAKRIIDSAKKLEGVARHASVHACGVVISKTPLADNVPLQRSPQDENSIITQFEMDSIDDLGLLKIDLLGLKNLTIIEETIRLIKEIKEEIVNVSEIPLNDKGAFKILQEGNTTGVFQLESSGMRRYLKELKPNDLEDIIAMVSLYRPGPIELIPSFIARKHGKEKITYLHPKLEPILKNTYGIGIYQEQMMKIAQDLAGFSLPEADTLRKAIGKKIKSLLEAQKEKLIKGMVNNGISEKIAKVIWELFPPFARYGFNRSHAVCYALIGYQTAYLKARWPIEFVTSLLNSDSGDLERITFLISEAKNMNVKILPPDINRSFADFAPEEKNIRFGLLAVKNVGKNIVDAIIEERQKSGPFKDFAEFLNRIDHKDLNKKSLESLVKVGVFDSLNIDRGILFLNMEEIISYLQNIRKSKNSSQNSLFGSNHYSNNFNFLKNNNAEITVKEKLGWEKELIGLYISGHPLNSHKNTLELNGVKPIKELVENKNGNNGSSLKRIGGVIASLKKIMSKSGQIILFVKIEDFTGSLETVVFSDTFSKNPNAWKENNTVMVEGKLSWRNNEPKFVCEKVVEL